MYPKVILRNDRNVSLGTIVLYVDLLVTTMAMGIVSLSREHEIEMRG
jgi:hypothetical protein